MMQRASYAPQDFQEMCEHAERGYESKKLAVLLERVKKRIAARESPALEVESPKPPLGVHANQSDLLRPPGGSALFEP